MPSWRHLGPILAPLGADFGSNSLGSSQACFRASWTNLGASWNRNPKQFEKSLRKPTAWNLFGKILEYFGTIFGDFLGSRRLPKSESEIEQILKRFLKDFGDLLGPLGGHVATKWAS